MHEVLREVSPRLFVAPSVAGTRRNDIYVWVGQQQVVVVDSGYAGAPRRVIGPLLRRVQDRPCLCILTHGDVDHFGGAAELMQLHPNVVITCHVDDRKWVTSVDRVIEERYREFAPEGLDRDPESLEEMRAAAHDAPVTQSLVGGEVLELESGREIMVHHVPGHTPGSLVLLDPVTGALVSGDAVLGESIRDSNGSPVMPPTYRNVEEYVRSIRDIQELNPSVIHTSHLGSFAGDNAAELLRTSLEHTSKVDQALMELLPSRSRMSLRKLVQLVAARLGGPWLAPPATLAMPLVAHLERLVSTGAVHASGAGKSRTFRLAR